MFEVEVEWVLAVLVRVERKVFVGRMIIVERV